ncbi:hypothetical protein N1851_013152 [Merluccius polli]|uniref:CCHC-type domain-containing protein n=1 Tax=Merluccius polli TaxID=89951 RepID=A0AA47MVN0_MERPO|nr:hypothetical protein N1851_013152 [Merluccius polli]
MEQLQDEVSRTLLTLEKSELIAVCEHLKCSEPSRGFDSTARPALIRLAETTLDEVEDDGDLESFQQFLQNLLSFVGSLKQSSLSTSDMIQQEPSELDTLKDKYKTLRQEQNGTRQQLEGEIGLLEERLKTKTWSADATPTTPILTKLPEVTLRREFRIHGQIGEAGQKDKLSYTTLINQIDSGQRKQHSEAEIIEAVTRAVSPGLHLREMLEIKRGLTLPALRTILRGHFKVDTSSDLLHRLLNVSQDPKESAQTFLFRAIELKDKLLWKSSEEDEGEQFSPELIQRKFLRSVDTGLLSDAVKFQLKPYLSSPSVTDEVLIERVSEAANLEQERQQKLKKVTMSKPPRLSEVRAEVNPYDSQPPHRGETEHWDEGVDTVTNRVMVKKGKKSQSKNAEPETGTSQLIEGLKAEMLEIKKMMLETVEATKKNQNERTATYNRPRLIGCRACQEAQLGESCRHCYKCGQEGHLSRGCGRSREDQGNWRGLLSRDPQ